MCQLPVSAGWCSGRGLCEESRSFRMSLSPRGEGLDVARAGVPCEPVDWEC